MKAVKCNEKIKRKCYYGAPLTGNEWCCDYLHIEGHRRACKPEECTVFKNGSCVKRGGVAHH